LRPGIRAVYDSPSGRWTVGAILVALFVVLLVRALLGGLVPGAADAILRPRPGGADEDTTDPWVRAQRLAAAGRYTDAAHALYRALLASVAARAALRLHPSKTAGDYARDLRRAAPASFGPFREFARDYEVVVYGYRSCDRPRFERLAALAARLDPRFAGLPGTGSRDE
jgi:uncharacterized protein DUF4129